MNREPVNVEVVETVSRQYVFMDESHKLEVLGAEEVETRRFNQPGFIGADKIALDKVVMDEVDAQKRILTNSRITRALGWAGSFGMGALTSRIGAMTEVIDNDIAQAAAGAVVAGALITYNEVLHMQQRTAAHTKIRASQNMQHFISAQTLKDLPDTANATELA